MQKPKRINRKKDTKARRKRPKRENLPEVKFVTVQYKDEKGKLRSICKKIFPPNPRGKNHSERRILKAKDRR